MKDEIRYKHALMEYDNEIKFCKNVISRGAKGEDLANAQQRLKEAEDGKRLIYSVYRSSQ